MYQLIDGFLDVVGIFFIVYLIGYSTFLFLSVVVGSIQLYRQHRQRRLQNYLPNDYHMPISIIVPAWNEAVTVVATVHSLLNLEYQAYEVIVVDDGSEDDTSQTLIEAFNMHAVHRPIRRQVPCQPEEFIYETRTQKVPFTVIRKKNGGKADALNMGINAANFPYFICMDADSVLQADSLKKIVQPMLEDRHVVAVGGLVRIANDVELEHGRVKKYRLPRNLLACMQVLEYDRSFLASRILFDQFNGSLIISGAFGLFRKDVVIAAGGVQCLHAGRGYGTGGKTARILHGEPYGLLYPLCHRCHMLDTGTGAAERPEKAAQALAPGAVPKHDEAPRNPV